MKELLAKYLAPSAPDLSKDDDIITPPVDAIESDLIEPLDTRGLFDRCSKDADFAARLLSKFISRLQVDRQQVERELARLNFQELARIGHSLLGTASTAGASLLAQAASQLDAGAREMDPETVNQAASHLLIEIDRLIAGHDRIKRNLAQLASNAEVEEVMT